MDVVVWMIILGLSGQIPSRSQSQVGLTSQVRSHCKYCSKSSGRTPGLKIQMLDSARVKIN